jgi:hypothetical protein
VICHDRDRTHAATRPRQLVVPYVAPAVGGVVDEMQGGYRLMDDSTGGLRLVARTAADVITSPAAARPEDLFAVCVLVEDVRAPAIQRLTTPVHSTP